MGDAIWRKQSCDLAFRFGGYSYQDRVRLCFIQHPNNYRGNVVDKVLLDAGYRAYTGEKIDVYFNTAICKHSGNCVRGSAKLFNLKRKPWIIPDEVDVETVVHVIDTCPSGALKYRQK
jgi:uncharacterized Fe-S cluster protein YjdI